VIDACLAWMSENLASPSPVTAMAERSGLTRRTFARRFITATGYRPIDYVHALRMESARQLLETGDATIDDVGYAVGYEDPTFFRRLFKRTTGMSPAAYRRKFTPITRSGRPPGDAA
jgi:transcriptional regulator GlxA family with amidase domain